MTNIQRYSASDLPELMEKIARNSIGLDDYFQQFWNTNTNANYPPYNIRKLPEDKYSIELAVAGFDEKDIDIEVSEQNLTIDGKKSDEMNENLIHQGLASRNFNRKFVLSEDMVVQGAALSNGILYIGIQRVIPENKKPKKIPLTSKESLLNS